MTELRKEAHKINLAILALGFLAPIKSMVNPIWMMTILRQTMVAIWNPHCFNGLDSRLDVGGK